MKEKEIEVGCTRGKAPKSFMSLQELTISGLLAGITIFLGITGYGFIPLFYMHATILHIPTIIGAIVAGPKVGMVVGFLFGAFSFIRTFQAPSWMMQIVLQYSVVYDAIICIIPRMCIALIAYYAYKKIPAGHTVRLVISSVLGSISNSVLFLGLIFLLVGIPYAADHDVTVFQVAMALVAVAGTNSILEVVVSGVVITSVVLMLQRSGWKLKK